MLYVANINMLIIRSQQHEYSALEGVYVTSEVGDTSNIVRPKGYLFPYEKDGKHHCPYSIIHEDGTIDNGNVILPAEKFTLRMDGNARLVINSDNHPIVSLDGSIDIKRAGSTRDLVITDLKVVTTHDNRMDLMKDLTALSFDNKIVAVIDHQVFNPIETTAK